MSSVHDSLTQQFSTWELRGRGWSVFDAPVAPEPAFHPFCGHYLENRTIDDGRKPTLLSSFFDRFKKKEPVPLPELDEEPEPEWMERESLVELQTSLPATLNIHRENFEQFLTHLGSCSEPIAFELIGTLD